MADHHFRPTVYYNTMGNHEPVMRIRDGDRVFTTTLDAHGKDRTGEPVGPWGNPMTGPFYIEEAEPGDTLAILFHETAPDRDWGWTANLIAENVLDPEFVPGLPERKIIRWKVDGDKQVAYPEETPPSLKGLNVPLETFMGCFGVAPPGGQSISTATSGPYGGNMDYRGFARATTIYFPVFAEGALFYLGDGHAAQGDGEIVGNGIEVSMNVSFTAKLIKGRTIRWPRGETPDEIFTVGNARPLDQAVQHATTEMLRWLTEEYSLDTEAASILLGQCVEYDLGNVYDPAYTMVCKLKKKFLPIP